MLYRYEILVTQQACAMYYQRKRLLGYIKNIKGLKGGLFMRLRQWFMCFASHLSSVALCVGIDSATKACWWWFAQPKVPKELEKFL